MALTRRVHLQNDERALRRIPDKAPIPTTCPHCQGHVALVDNREIYGRSFGDWPYAYLCERCDAYVGLHPNTDIPLGTLADKATREARKKAKEAFHDVVDLYFSNRGQAYKWLSEELEIPRSECHFGMMDEDTCATAYQVCLDRMND